jgi:hypothetical protein
MAHLYEIVVRVNFGPPEHYMNQVLYEDHVKQYIARLNGFGSGSHVYSARLIERNVSW